MTRTKFLPDPQYQWDIPDAFHMSKHEAGHSWRKLNEIRGRVGFVPAFSVMRAIDPDLTDGLSSGPFCGIILVWTKADRFGPEADPDG